MTPRQADKLIASGSLVLLQDIDEWDRFAVDNHDALVAAYGSIEKAYRHATQGGLTLGGGAAPLFIIRFAE